MSDVDLFAGLGSPSPAPSPPAASVPTPRTPPPEGKPWPPVRDGGYCEPVGEPSTATPAECVPAGRWLRCREPSAAVDCLMPAVDGCARCLDHLRPGDLLCYADSYAIASILYYTAAEAEFMTDAQFDGLCSALLGARAWKVVPWLEKEMLKAGSGYDLEKFPPELHEAAREWLESAG